MFKKKSNLPPRPKCPTASQMIEDLSVVLNEDPVFATAKTILEETQRDDEPSENEAAYQKINQFFTSHEELKEVIKNLNMTNTSLREKECDMMKMSEQLKNQAIKALI